MAFRPHSAMLMGRTPHDDSGPNHSPPRSYGRQSLRSRMRVIVGMIVGLVASDHPNAEILHAYPYLEEEDIRQALAYAASV
jgi:uncharacterized protein (DUF433 family)